MTAIPWPEAPLAVNHNAGGVRHSLGGPVRAAGRDRAADDCGGGIIGRAADEREEPTNPTPGRAVVA